MKFIDLFAGLGGFHVAFQRLGHECVFASEIDEGLQELYLKNFGIKPHGDIRNVAVQDIPKHDILCAGSPCQPFSKAGEQAGFDCPKWGDLLEYVVKVTTMPRTMLADFPLDKSEQNTILSKKIGPVCQRSLIKSNQQRSNQHSAKIRGEKRRNKGFDCLMTALSNGV
jgi:C-5 cytosine-specific DNA methylase